MLRKEKYRAIGMMAAMIARQKVAEDGIEVNKVIDLSPLLREWAEGSFMIGDVRVYKGIPYKCAQAHDSTGNPDWNPEKAHALWTNYHGTDVAHALPYVQPTGAHDAYMTGEFMVYTDDVTYECVVDGTVHAPDVIAASWKAVVE